MFSQSITPEANLLLTSLLIIWAALLFGGFILGKLNAERTRRMPTWTRLASSFVLVIAALTWMVIAVLSGDWQVFQNGIPTDRIVGLPEVISSYGILIAIGMTLGFIGD